MKQGHYTEKELTDIYVSNLPEDKFDIIDTNHIVHFVYRDEDYYVMLRSISYAGHPHPVHRYRAQLQKRPYLETYKNNGGVFLFLGYDANHDVYVLWNPFTLRPRLNEKDSVSLFCELDAISSSVSNGIVWSKLPNGGLYVAFTPSNMSSILDSLTYFNADLSEQNNDTSQVDITLSKFIWKMIKEDASRLEIIEACMDEFTEIYPAYEYTDWSKLVRIVMSNPEPTPEPVIHKTPHSLEYYLSYIETVHKKYTEAGIAVQIESMLLATIDYIQWRQKYYDTSNILPLLANWEGCYLNRVSEYQDVKRKSTAFSRPFLALDKEIFWHNIAEDGFKRSDNAHDFMTYDHLQEAYTGVEIDEEFYKLLLEPESRKQIQNTILELLTHACPPRG